MHLSRAALSRLALPRPLVAQTSKSEARQAHVKAGQSQIDSPWPELLSKSIHSNSHSPHNVVARRPDVTHFKVFGTVPIPSRSASGFGRLVSNVNTGAEGF